MTGPARSALARATSAPVLLAVGFGLLLASWVGAQPLGAGPDEFANNVKVLASARGQLLGQRVYQVQPSLPPRAHVWYLRSSRSYALPASLVMPGGLACMAFRPRVPATCQRRADLTPAPYPRFETQLAYYPPLVPLLVGLPSLGTHTADAAAYANRIGSALLCLVLLAAAAWFAGAQPRAAPALAGLALAVTPTVVFLGAVQGASGVEICAGVCTWSAALAGTRREPPRGWWAALVLSAALWMQSRPLDVVLFAACAVVVALATGVRWRVAPSRRAGLVGGALLGLSGLAGIVWDAVVMPAPLPWRGTASAAVHTFFAQGGYELQQAVGVFGWTDTLLPTWVYATWGALVVALAGTAVAVAPRRGAAAVLALPVAILGYALGLTVFAIAPNGFVFQARYVLALAVGLPILAGELWARHAPPRSLLRAAGAVVAVAGVLQLVAAWVDERRYAVGELGPWWFLGHGWRPPGGQLLWAVLAALGAAVMALAGARSGAELSLARLGSGRSHPPPG